MFGFAIVDIAVIVGYFLIVLMIGVWASRRIRDEEDYFLAGRRFGKFVQTFAAFGQATSSDSAVSATTFISRNGIAGLTQQLINGFSLPIFWITSVWYRRLRTLTLGDFFAERYNSKWMPALYSWVSALLFMLITGISLMAMTRTVTAISAKPVGELNAVEMREYQAALEQRELENTDSRLLSLEQQTRLEQLRVAKPSLSFSYLDENMVLWVVAIFVVVYAIMGGLEAAFVTDTMQGIGIILLSLVMIPFAFIHMNNMLNEAMLERSMNVVNMTCRFSANERERLRIASLLGEVDAVVITNHYTRYDTTNNSEFISKLARDGVPLIVITNCPYEMGAVPEAGTVICTFGAAKESLQAAADVIYGNARANGRWPLRDYEQEECDANGDVESFGCHGDMFCIGRYGASTRAG